MVCEIEGKADFGGIRYAQCWEDADVLLAALNVRPGGVYLSIASAGDNVLAILSRGPRRLVALDVNRAQIACLALRVAAFRELEHGELLELMGSTASRRRLGLYDRCRTHLTPEMRAFWDARRAAVAQGIGAVGKLERFLHLYRRYVLPLAHPRSRVERLFRPRDRRGRQRFYDVEWNNRRWRGTARVFFSRAVISRLGRDPRFFDYAEGGIAGHLLQRAGYALSVLDPAANPYLQWLLLGRHRSALPYALRPENFQAIRANLDRLDVRVQSLEDFIETPEASGLDGFNLSDIFEYMSKANAHRLLEKLIGSGRQGARLVYWNLLAPRRRPGRLAQRLRPLEELAAGLLRMDQVFFYSALNVEEIL
jgi:S-adenosylmethionine-diacylglycerol 3-amino-3-carboxypropyl transferase